MLNVWSFASYQVKLQEEIMNWKFEKWIENRYCWKCCQNLKILSDNLEYVFCKFDIVHIAKCILMHGLTCWCFAFVKSAYFVDHGAVQNDEFLFIGHDSSVNPRTINIIHSISLSGSKTMLKGINERVWYLVRLSLVAIDI